ncbi:oligosaccharide flippase family protein, partial [Synechococcus moorigangaii CMS01]|nr:oligosaccharide flippase family protein [Synechococcus moorigangaii CMS01]
MTNLLSKSVNNSLWTGVASFGSAILGFIFAGLTIRLLGASEAGFSIAVASIVGINNLVTGFGLGSAAIRVISRAYEEGKIKEIKKTGGVCLTFSIVFGGANCLIIGFIAPWIIQWSQYQGESKIAIFYCWMMGILVLLQQLASYYDLFLVSLQRYDWRTKIDTFYFFMNCIMGIIFLSLFPTIWMLALIQVISLFIKLLLKAFIVFKLLNVVTYPLWDKVVFVELWSFGKWIYLTQLTSSLMNGLDKIFLTSMFGSSLLPLYAFPQRIYQLVHSILLGQSSYLFPLLSSQGERMDIISLQIEDRVRWFLGLLAALIYSGLIIIGPSMLSIIVDSQFSERASFTLITYCWVGFIQANYIASYQISLSQGESKKNWITALFNNLIPLVSLVVLANLYGFKYANLGNLMVICACLYNNRFYKQDLQTKDFFLWFFSPIYSSCLIMAIANLLSIIKYVQPGNSHITSLMILLLFYTSIIPLISRLELRSDCGAYRVKTLKKAILMILQKFRLSLKKSENILSFIPVSYTHLRAHETRRHLVCR